MEKEDLTDLGFKEVEGQGFGLPFKKGILIFVEPNEFRYYQWPKPFEKYNLETKEALVEFLKDFNH